MKVYCRACFLFCSHNDNPLKIWAKWVIITIVYLVSLIGGNVGLALIFADDSKVCYETIWFGSCYWDAFPLTLMFLTPFYLSIATFVVAWRNSRQMWQESYREAKGLHNLINEDPFDPFYIGHGGNGNDNTVTFSHSEDFTNQIDIENST